MTSVLVDSNVLLDVLGEENIWSAWSAATIEGAGNSGRLIINPVVYGEVSVRFSSAEATRLCSGAQADRSGLRLALDYVRDGRCADRLETGPSQTLFAALIDTVTTLEKRSVGFRSITEAIDTTTPGGRLAFSLVWCAWAVRARFNSGAHASGFNGRGYTGTRWRT
jgi:hypothetical protein